MMKPFGSQLAAYLPGENYALVVPPQIYSLCGPPFAHLYPSRPTLYHYEAVWRLIWGDCLNLAGLRLSHFIKSNRKHHIACIDFIPGPVWANFRSPERAPNVNVVGQTHLLRCTLTCELYRRGGDGPSHSLYSAWLAQFPSISGVHAGTTEGEDEVQLCVNSEAKPLGCWVFKRDLETKGSSRSAELD